MPHLDPIILQIIDQHLTLCRFACAIQAFEHYEFTSRHVVGFVIRGVVATLQRLMRD